MHWILLLAACAPPAPGTDEPPPPEHQGPGPAEEGPKGPAPGCAKVIDAAGANAIFSAGRTLEGVDADCTFEDVHVTGSVVEVAFETPDETKVPATLHLLACLSGGPPAGAHVADPWVLEVPAASEARCPKGFAALRAALSAGAFPPPSDAR